ncbi:multi-sensor signal transduction histidine kinase [Cyclobacterium qasimii M12-11B]|nr:multi-sensor signal transduction histidine kinase [Cyclobacterium qasimii M12-11B]
MKIMPYLTQQGFMEGIVMSFIDITHYHNSQLELKEAQQIANMGSWVLDNASNVLSCSEEIYKIFQVEQSDFNLNFESFIEFIHIEDRNKVSESLYASIKNKIPFEIEHRIVTKENEVKYVREKCRTDYDTYGNPLTSFGILVDISDKKKEQIRIERSNKIDKTISELSEIAISHNVDLENYSEITLKKLMKLISCKNGYIAINNEDKTERIVLANAGRSCIISNNCNNIYDKSEASCFCNVRFNLKKIFISNDINEFRKEYKIEDNDINWNNYMSVPIYSDVELLGQIVLFDKSTDFNEDDISIVKRFAAKFAMVLLRIQAKEKLNLNINLYRSIFQNISNGFAFHEIILDKKGNPIDYKFIDINESFEKLTGLQKENVIGETIKHIIPEIENEWIEKYGHVALTGEQLIFEHFSQPLKKRYKVNAYSPEKGLFATIFEEIK